MATRKKKAKRKSKASKRKAPARKPVARARKKAARKTAPKKAPARRAPATARKPAARRPAARPAPAVKPPPGPRVGVVTHYFNHLSVAVVKLETGTLRVGDAIHFRGHTTDFGQRVDSLQVDHRSVEGVGPNDDFGVKVRDAVREHDVVYKVT